MTVRIEQVDWAQRRHELLDIRHAVFVREQGVPIELEHDTHDRDARHLLAWTDDGHPVGTARMLDDGHIGRMAVLPDWRHRGVGSALIGTLITIARTAGYHQVYLHAQCTAVPFYTRFGFVASGEVFIDAGIEHRCMRLELRRLVQHPG